MKRQRTMLPVALILLLSSSPEKEQRVEDPFRKPTGTKSPQEEKLIKKRRKGRRLYLLPFILFFFSFCFSFS